MMSTIPRTSSSTSPELKQSPISPLAKSPSHIPKRKHSNGEEYGLKAAVVNSGKRKRIKISKSNEDDNLDLDQGLNLAIAKLDNRLLADYIAKRTKRFFPDLSLVELEDRYVSGVF